MGKCLTGIDVNSTDFVILPPHFRECNPMDDTKVKEAVNLMCGSIVEKQKDSWKDQDAVVSRSLASVICHTDWIVEVSESTPGHPFLQSPLLQHPTLIESLKNEVTLEPTESMPKATGVPPHIVQICLLQKVLFLCNDTLEKVSDFLDDFSIKLDLPFILNCSKSCFV